MEAARWRTASIPLTILKKVASMPVHVLFPRFALSLLSVFACASSALSAPAFEAVEGDVAPLEVGCRLFSNRDFTALAVPDALAGARFIRTDIEAEQTLTCTQPGTIYAITPAEHPENSLAADLRAQGFEQLPAEPFQLFGRTENDRALVFRKAFANGEKLATRKWIILAAHGDLRLTHVPDPVRLAARHTDWRTNDGETLTNGIRLPRVWPPRNLDPASDAPMPVPYLDHPPAVIPVDTGRQLFVDDFLIESTDLTRTFHTAKKHEGNPVFKPETPAELKPAAVCYLGHGGVFYDPAERLVKMWYSAGDLDGALAFATSRDGFTWERPDLGLPAGGNHLLPRGGRTPGTHAGGDNCLWLDTFTTNAAERLKFLVQRSARDPHWLATSADGRDWSAPVPAGRAGDYCSFFFNPFRNVWVYSVKRDGSRGRNRYYAESPVFLTEGAFNNSVYWCNADRLDEQDSEAKCPPQLYSLNAVAYESLMLGVFYVHLGPPNEVCAKGKFPKITELKLGFSRDGFHWNRPDRRAFIPASRVEGTWDRAYVHSTAGVCLIDGDRLLFPYCAFSGIAPDGSRGVYHGASVGIATLRRDGFASMDGSGTLTTRPIVFSGKHLFVNATGALTAEVLDAATDEVLLPPFTAGSVDSTRHLLGNVSAFANRPVRIRFHLTGGSLYSFWISPSTSGASGGYLAAGSLNQPNIIDLP